MNEQLHAQLRAFGLNNSEIVVYLFLLENGLSTPPIVSRETKIARTNCYNILEDLKAKGLISEQADGKRKAYLAKDPEALILALEAKKETVRQILPDLRGLYTTQRNKPKIHFYDGVDAIKEIYLQTLESKKILAIGSSGQLKQLVPEFFDYYEAEILRRQIVFYDILGKSSENVSRETKELLKGYYDTKFFPENKEQAPTDILIWDNNVALLSLTEPVFGTVLTNPQLAKTFQIVFETLWERL